MPSRAGFSRERPAHSHGCMRSRWSRLHEVRLEELTDVENPEGCVCPPSFILAQVAGVQSRCHIRFSRPRFLRADRLSRGDPVRLVLRWVILRF